MWTLVTEHVAAASWLGQESLLTDEPGSGHRAAVPYCARRTFVLWCLDDLAS